MGQSWRDPARTEIDFDLPVLPDDAIFTHLEFSLNRILTAYCPDETRYWRHNVDVDYADGPAAGTDTSTTWHFPQEPCFTDRLLTVATSGAGTVRGIGISCPPDCSERIAEGELLTLSAWPGAGAAFASWGGACSGTGTICAVTMSSDAIVTAGFVPALRTDSKRKKKKKKKKRRKKRR
jgi:hypothetical protein